MTTPMWQQPPRPKPRPRVWQRHRKMVVVALYDYDAMEDGDMSLREHDELEVLDDAQPHWWKMRNIKTGLEGFVPSNFVRKKEASHDLVKEQESNHDLVKEQESNGDSVKEQESNGDSVKEQESNNLQQYEWYWGGITRQQAEEFLMERKREGAFVVRNSTTNPGMYSLAVFSQQSRPQVKHYHINKNQEGNYCVSHIKCPTIPELIYKHQHNPAGLCTRLRPLLEGQQAPTTAGLGHSLPTSLPAKYEIDPSLLNLMEELGSGQFSVVRRGKLGSMHVAVKVMKEGTMSEDEFINEAKLLRQLMHRNLVQLYGVCSKCRPICIVTEYLSYGSLLNYLRDNERPWLDNAAALNMCSQVCAGMEYLEKKNFIHRNLAARNCLVGANLVIKVGDFGLSRFVVDDEYDSSGGAKFPIKWAAPEVLHFMKFSSKSDVWAFGVLMWEVWTCGKIPYGRMRNHEVVEMVQNGRVLERPRRCPHDVYNIMRQCWTPAAKLRPSFKEILSNLKPNLL